MPHRTRQRDRILELLTSRSPDWIALPELLALRIAQYNARVLELRRAGFSIENRMEWIDGRRRSWFRLVHGPRLVTRQDPPRAAAPLLFPELEACG